MGEAREFGHPHVGTEHLRLGLLHPESVPAVTLLTEMGIPLNRARMPVVGWYGSEPVHPFEHSGT